MYKYSETLKSSWMRYIVALVGKESVLPDSGKQQVHLKRCVSSKWVVRVWAEEELYNSFRWS